MYFRILCVQRRFFKNKNSLQYVFDAYLGGAVCCWLVLSAYDYIYHASIHRINLVNTLEYLLDSVWWRRKKGANNTNQWWNCTCAENTTENWQFSLFWVVALLLIMKRVRNVMDKSRTYGTMKVSNERKKRIQPRTNQINNNKYATENHIGGDLTSQQKKRTVHTPSIDSWHAFDARCECARYPCEQAARGDFSLRSVVLAVAVSVTQINVRLHGAVRGPQIADAVSYC